MSICCGYITSLAFWATRNDDGGSLPRLDFEDMGELSARVGEARTLRLRLAELGAFPGESAFAPDTNVKAGVRNSLHVIVPSREKRSHTPGVITHAPSRLMVAPALMPDPHAAPPTGNPIATAAHVSDTPIQLPAQSFCEIGPGQFVASPELTFYEIASRSNNLWRAIETGYLLCSGFSLSPLGYERVARRVPLTSRDSIADFLEALSGAWGINKARKALSFVKDECDSPPEIQLSMELGMPDRLGGRGWPVHCAAYKIDLDNERYQRILGCNYVKADLYLESVNGILEYDSYEDHMGKWQFDHTQKRAGVLRAMQYEVVSVTHGMVMNNREFDDSLYTWEEELGISHKAPTHRTLNLQHEMHNFLISQERRRF